MISRLFIAAKPPLPRQAKTRLGNQLGHERAAAIYGGFLADLGARFRGFPHSVGWFVPDGAWPAILAAIGPAWSGAPVVVQRGGDWTERQRALFAGAARRGEECTVVMASDSPHLSREVVVESFERLRQADVVLGPVHDGGYYLLGIRGSHDVLAGVPMSNASVSQAIEARCARLGLDLRLVETTFDVDEVQDLEPLRILVRSRADLAATRAALR